MQTKIAMISSQNYLQRSLLRTMGLKSWCMNLCVDRMPRISNSCLLVVIANSAWIQVRSARTANCRRLKFRSWIVPASAGHEVKDLSTAEGCLSRASPASGLGTETSGQFEKLQQATMPKCVQHSLQLQAHKRTTHHICSMAWHVQISSWQWNPHPAQRCT